jgi:hypothetical protein
VRSPPLLLLPHCFGCKLARESQRVLACLVECARLLAGLRYPWVEREREGAS